MRARPQAAPAFRKSRFFIAGTDLTLPGAAGVAAL
jgi:hypothetical protein